MLFILQGIDGSIIQFEKPKTKLLDTLAAPATCEIGVRIDSSVPQATQDLIHQLAELGCLFKRIKTALEDQSRRQRGGLTLQSLYFALEGQLKDYYRLIATLETRLQSRDQLLRPSQSDSEREQESSLTHALDPLDGLTLRRMAVWTADMKLRIRMMGVLIDGSDRELVFFTSNFSFLTPEPR